MFHWFRNTVRRILAATTSSPASWFVEWIRGNDVLSESDSGIPVDGQTCLKYAPVWNAVNRVCGRVAQLPLILYEWTDADQKKKRRATEHPAYRLLKREPNKQMIPAVFKELVQYHALVFGNGRAEIVRNGRADPTALIPLLPDRTKTVLINGDKWHITEVIVDAETQRTEKRKIRDENCLHIPGLGYDGIAGYALWDLAKNSWGLGLGQEKRANKFYRNNAVPGLILEAPAGTFEDDEEAKKFLTAFREMQEGLDNTARTGLLRNGIKATKLSMSDQESQTVEQRKFQRQDVALWFMLETILGDDETVSYNSLEQKHLAELINCLNIWLVKWQEECERKLLREREKLADRHFIRFSTGALLRTDMKTTYTMLSAAVRGTIMTQNEAREVIDLPPVDGGDELKNPAITPGNPPPPEESAGKDGAGDEKDGKEEKGQAKEMQDRLRGVIAGRLAELAAVEVKRIEAAAATPETFTKWVNGFYAKWQKTLTDAVQSLAGSDQSAETIAVAWCEESRRLLAAEPFDDIAPTLWTERAGELADQLTSL